MLLSVVIPFYNVEAYIENCLALVCELPQEECEVLLVDDCGTDGSLGIARQFEKSMTNFRIISRKENGGLSAARNTGLDEAKGEYVYFLDSDDVIVPSELMALTRRAELFELDVAKGRYICFDDDTGEESPGMNIARTMPMEGGALFAAQCRAGVYEPMVWQCVYRREFLRENNLRMAEGLLFEDELFQAPALLKAARAAAFEETILCYRQREGSIMKSFAKSDRWCASYLEVCRRLKAVADELADGEAKQALKKRIGQIALSVVKNITAYGLEGDVARGALAFAEEHKRELAGYAAGSGDALVSAQGALLGVSVKAFMKLYGHKK